MAGYNTTNLTEGKTALLSGDEIKFKISENDVEGFTLRPVDAVATYVVQHSFDGGATWITVTGAAVDGDKAYYYTPGTGLFGPLGRISVTGAGTITALYYAKRT